MSPTAFFLSLLLAGALCYLIIPAWLVIRGWIVSGGLLQFIGAVLPGIWQEVFWPNEAGNFYLLMMVLVPIPLCIIVTGCVINTVRLIGWLLKSRSRCS